MNNLKQDTKYNNQLGLALHKAASILTQARAGYVHEGIFAPMIWK